MTAFLRSAESVTLPPARIDRSSPVPLHHQVATWLEGLIVDQTLLDGARLTNEIDLAAELGVSRPTMRRALAHLVGRGLLVRRRGVGTTVRTPPVGRAPTLRSMHQDIVDRGATPRTTVLVCEPRPAEGMVAEALGVAPETSVTWIERVRHADEEPVAILHNAIPADVARLDGTDLETHGLYDLLGRARCVPHTARDVLSARAATAAEARLLGEPRRAPLLVVHRTTWNARGRAVEYAVHHFRARTHRVETTIGALGGAI
ncbi:GntR family transcriptional regulator [Pseudonocardia sp. RS11V-5]|nr:GntR family transcriptional regulator [Pseudonocardia terrae]MCE3555916.1 GntR family transcriptional regulator [Pseudonocardia terrae]